MSCQPPQILIEVSIPYGKGKGGYDPVYGLRHFVSIPYGKGKVNMG